MQWTSIYPKKNDKRKHENENRNARKHENENKEGGEGAA
jgi:hypothetical protein